MNYNITGYSKCSCGAITFYIDGDTSNGYSCRQSNVNKFFPNLDLRTLRKGRLQESYSCNHCVNHYGLDLCGCGSGKPFGHCDSGLEECNRPMQVVGEYYRVRAKDAWL